VIRLPPAVFRTGLLAVFYPGVLKGVPLIASTAVRLETATEADTPLWLQT